MPGLIRWLRPSEESMTRLWQYVCESYCTVYRSPPMRLHSREAMAEDMQWPSMPDWLHKPALWLKRRGYLRGCDGEFAWCWAWSWEPYPPHPPDPPPFDQNMKRLDESLAAMRAAQKRVDEYEAERRLFWARLAALRPKRRKNPWH